MYSEIKEMKTSLNSQIFSNNLIFLFPFSLFASHRMQSKTSAAVSTFLSPPPVGFYEARNHVNLTSFLAINVCTRSFALAILLSTYATLACILPLAREKSNFIPKPHPHSRQVNFGESFFTNWRPESPRELLDELIKILARPVDAD
jgi:hypothetical protein